MNCEELRPDYLLYAMGTMVEPEMSEMRAHLARGCPACTEGLRQAEALAYSVGATVKGPDAPRDLRARVLAIAGTDALQAKAGPQLVTRTPPMYLLGRPIAAWQGLALAAACVILALVPAAVVYRNASESHASQSALLDNERRSAAALRERVAQLQADATPHSAPIYALEFERGGAGEPLKQIAIPHGAAAVVLALPIDLVRQASAAELRDSSGKVLWTLSPLAAGDADSTGLTIPSRLLGPGRYELVLTAGGKILGRLAFQAVAR